jgi:hypothetical protein
VGLAKVWRRCWSDWSRSISSPSVCRLDHRCCRYAKTGPTSTVNLRRAADMIHQLGVQWRAWPLWAQICFDALETAAVVVESAEAVHRGHCRGGGRDSDHEAVEVSNLLGSDGAGLVDVDVDVDAGSGRVEDR